LLAAKDDAPKLWAIMDEAAPRRVVGGHDVISGQVARLLEARSLPNVTIQVIPFGAGAHPGMDGSFVILDFPDGEDPGIVYLSGARATIRATLSGVARFVGQGVGCSDIPASAQAALNYSVQRSGKSVPAAGTRVPCEPSGIPVHQLIFVPFRMPVNKGTPAAKNAQDTAIINLPVDSQTNYAHSS